MTPDEFAEKMKRIVEETGCDVEACHGEMDDAMCELLTELGYGDGIQVFYGAEKWYA